MVFDNIEATFEFEPCTNYLVPLTLSVQNVTQQQYEILILFVSFQLSKSC